MAGTGFESATLHCPIRGQLDAQQRATNRLTFTEEKQRIDALRYLLQRQYPAEHIGVETTLFKIGHAGKNSFRTDFAIYDVPFDDVRGRPFEERLDHVRLLAEIKRDHKSAKVAKATQVKPALRLVPALGTLGVYWDDIEQRFFYKKVEGSRQNIIEAPISKIPLWGNAVESTQLRHCDLGPASDLVGIFDELEDILHPQVVDKSARYDLIQQLLLAKIHDENLFQQRPTELVEFQDFSAAAVTDAVVVKRMNAALKKAVKHYSKYLPKSVADRFKCNAEALRNATKILAPLDILGSRTTVIQEFYMKFAKGMYKWDLAQYFTPHEVIDFIVGVLHPQYGEHVKDPACGSADFLISAFRHVEGQASSCIWGSDHSDQAVQISVLNMVLNGDGKSQIEVEDSLEAYNCQSQQFNIVLCNPPFGTKILERRSEVLSRFDMGHEWKINKDGNFEKTDTVRTNQQTGILFAELCVRLAEPGGRIGIILPNGYLGNQQGQYFALREWLLRHTRVVGIVAFPRFTFKKSGADVSASSVFLEKLEEPLTQSDEVGEYRFYAGLVESVGWNVGNKKARPIYLRNQETGQIVLDESNTPIIDTDFNDVMADFLRSPATHYFPWLLAGRDAPAGPQTWSVPIGDVLASDSRTLDPKRHSAKFHVVRKEIQKQAHFSLGDVLEVIPQPRSRPESSEFYRYVEIQNITQGEYDYETQRGWQLPDRARLRAEPGDIFIARPWGCAGKWFVATGECHNLVVTNGCTRLRFKEGQEEEYGPDLAVGLCSEAFRVQMRALARGSDGLAEVSDEDLLAVVLPRLESATARGQALEYLDMLRGQKTRFGNAIGGIVSDSPEYPSITPRKSHCSVV